MDAHPTASWKACSCVVAKMSFEYRGLGREEIEPVSPARRIDAGVFEQRRAVLEVRGRAPHRLDQMSAMGVGEQGLERIGAAELVNPGTPVREDVETTQRQRRARPGGRREDGIRRAPRRSA